MTLTQNHAEVMLDALAQLTTRILDGETAPWEDYEEFRRTGLEDRETYLRTLGAARDLVRSVVSGDTTELTIPPLRSLRSL